MAVVLKMLTKRKLCLAVTTVSVVLVYVCAITIWNKTALQKLKEEVAERFSVARRNFAHNLRPRKTKENKVFDDVRTFLLFIGYPRSGSTLLGSLLDAHPHVIIANEFDIFGGWQQWEETDKNKYFLFDQLLNNSKEQSLTGYRSATVNHRYKYSVPGQWQGKYKEGISVIGTKKAGQTTKYLMSREGMKVLKKIHQAVNVSMKFIHVIRNPYDNIATMMLRDLGMRNQASAEEKVNEPSELDNQISKYSALAKRNYELKKLFGKNVLHVHSSLVIERPNKTLGEICKFLQLTCGQRYLEDCFSVIYTEASKTRHSVVWMDKQKKLVKEIMANFPFLKNYSFED